MEYVLLGAFVLMVIGLPLLSIWLDGPRNAAETIYWEQQVAKWDGLSRKEKKFESSNRRGHFKI